MLETEKLSLGVIQTKTLVKNKEGITGVVVDDPFGCRGSGEVPVVYEGTTHFKGTNFEDLEIIGPENAIADLKKCGAGLGKDTCIFLIIGSKGPECQRFGELRYDLITRKSSMIANREPTELYPKCQLG